MQARFLRHHMLSHFSPEGTVCVRQYSVCPVTEMTIELCQTYWLYIIYLQGLIKVSNLRKTGWLQKEKYAISSLTLCSYIRFLYIYVHVCIISIKRSAWKVTISLTTWWNHRHFNGHQEVFELNLWRQMVVAIPQFPYRESK